MQAPDTPPLKEEQTGCISPAGHDTGTCPPRCWDRAMHRAGGSSVPLPGLLAGGLALFWGGGRLGPPRPPSRHCCSVPGDCLLLQPNDAQTRAAAARGPARPDSPRWLLTGGHLPSLTSVCKIPGKIRRRVEARVPSLFWGLPGAGLLNRGSSVPHVGSGAGQERR